MDEDLEGVGAVDAPQKPLHHLQHRQQQEVKAGDGEIGLEWGVKEEEFFEADVASREVPKVEF